MSNRLQENENGVKVKDGRNTAVIFGTVLLVLLLVLIFTRAFGMIDDSSPADDVPEDPGGVSADPAGTQGPELTPQSTPESTPEQTPQVELFPYDGVVEHIFFHPLVAYPELAFDGDYQSDGFDDWMVTVDEYIKILESLYEKDYILVDINSVYSETVNENGTAVMQRNTLNLPEGKKPIILSFDDVCYYDYMQKNGFVYKLILDNNGNIATWGIDPDGKEVIAYDLDIITILDAFVAEHPDFSLGGVKGSLGLTGYEGILGYRTQVGSSNRASEIEAVKPVIARLKETGWNFVSHSYGHIDMNVSSYEKIVSDTEKWLDEVGSLVGETQVLLYPHGARVDENDGAAFKYLQSVGFRMFLSVGIEPYIKIHTNSPAVCGDRMHPDGTTLRHFRSLYLRLYDAKDIINLEVRPDRPYSFD